METKIIITLFFIMFIYSGFNKIVNYTKKVGGLNKRTNKIIPEPLLQLGMIGVIILEIVGSLMVINYFWNKDNIVKKEIIEKIMIVFLVFLVVVTIIYHPPTEKMIPFLSNLTTFSGLFLIKNML